MGLSFMLVPLLVIAVIVIIVVAGSKIDFREEGGEEMIKNVYIYLVLFATLMMTIGGSVAAFMAVADIYAPVAYHQSFEDFKRFDRIAIALLTKYFDKLYYAERARWESKVVGYDLVTMDDDNENFLNEEKDEYTITVNNTDENETMILWIRQIIDKVSEAKKKNQIIDLSEIQGDMAVVGIREHLFNPLLYLAKGNIEINVSPVALNQSELRFVNALKKHVSENDDFFKDKKLYLIRNRSRKGIGFFEDKGFFPDFIMWLIAAGKQYINFIDPHGMGREPITSDKVALHKRIKTEIESSLTDSSVSLNSFILSPTKYVELPDKSVSVSDWNANNVFFMEDNNYIEKIFNSIGG